jgi:hypothetical protein
MKRSPNLIELKRVIFSQEKKNGKVIIKKKG